MPFKLDRPLDTIPADPGVYLFKNEAGEILYIGKARLLRNRVRQYVHPGRGVGAKTVALLTHASTLDVMVTGSELEALLLESTLIKKHRPRYNVALKDNQRYPYIELTLGEEWPRLRVTRVQREGKSRYFGPYVDVSRMWETIHVIRDQYPLCRCRPARARKGRPCLNYYIGKCLGPCHEGVPRDSYMAMIGQIIKVLSGFDNELLNELSREMQTLSAAMKYEQAARVRDRITAIKKLMERQRVVLGRKVDKDIMVFCEDGPLACVLLIKVRGGQVIGRRHVCDDTKDEPAVMAENFLIQYYLTAQDAPPRLIMAVPGADTALMARWFLARFQKTVEVGRPRRGEEAGLAALADRNARQCLNDYALARMKDGDAIAELQRCLQLDRRPVVIECFDISNIQGRYAVGAMVRFREGQPEKKGYRRFRVRAENTPDDTAMMKEVVHRRYQRVQKEDPAGLPDLVMVDGGVGQLNAAKSALNELSLNSLPLIALAKREETVFSTTMALPLLMDRRSVASLFLQRVRDEAHRFAVTYHRLVRSREEIASAFTLIPGVGEKKASALYGHFKSFDVFSRASADELAAVKGISRKQAKDIFAFFHRRHSEGQDPIDNPGGQ